MLRYVGCGSIEPEELAILQRIFDHLSAELPSGMIAQLAVALFVGAILLRSQPIADNLCFPVLAGKPVLVISGLRDPGVNPVMRCSLWSNAGLTGANVTHHALAAGHDWAPDDQEVILAPVDGRELPTCQVNCLPWQLTGGMAGGLTRHVSRTFND